VLNAALVANFKAHLPAATNSLRGA
jgi:hypothetical protein